MSTVTTHVLDTALGAPAAGVAVRLESADGAVIASGATNADGRIGELGPDDLAPGVYRIWFGTGDYFARDGRKTFYPEVMVTFEVANGGGHYHVPLTLSPFAYSTYRGS
ncbi:MAG: hydroxyisourate hydrolase [Actinobacteria bacterium]|nr:hydroxyisourate hydrolase [Actinomycetota bacterium]